VITSRFMNLMVSKRSGLLLAALLVPSGFLDAAAIPVFGTGTDSNHIPLVAGANDPHYTVTYAAVTAPAVIDSFHGDGAGPGVRGAWVPDQPDAVWVSTANSLGGLPANVPVSYTTTFDLTGLNPGTVSITVRWAVDDSGSTGAFLNGVAIPGSAAPRDGSTNTSEPWAHFTTFTIDSQHQTFNPTTNTLTFVQDPSDDNANGVIVEISGTATPLGPPSIFPGGVVPIFSSATTIQSGSWISIFGSNLSTAVALWDGSFPTALGGTSVTINNKPAYLWYVSPGQLNVQAPDDASAGTVTVVVTVNGASGSATVTLGAFGPSLSLLDSKHVAGIIYRADGSGAYGGGTYDLIGPVGAFPFTTQPAKAGDVISLFGVGFGPTDPSIPVPAGHLFTGPPPATVNPVNVLINGTTINASFAGIVQAGLYQLNLTIPAGLQSGDQPIVATVGGVQTQQNIVIALQ
jgi:uncharacterized protein (TIGR03437 family)